MTLPSATIEVAKSSTTGSAFSRGMPTQKGAVESLRSRRRRARRESSRRVTKWMETRPSAAAISAHSPTRPIWPASRSERRQGPPPCTLRCRCGPPPAHRLAKAIAAVDDGERGRVDENLDRLVRRDVAGLHPVDIARHADDAVAVVAREIGADQRARDAQGLLARRADALERIGADRFEGGDGDGDHGH